MRVADCLAALNVDQNTLNGAGSPSAEFNAVRKAFLRKAIETHPDKHGGSNEQFQAVYDRRGQYVKLRPGLGPPVKWYSVKSQTCCGPPSNRKLSVGPPVVSLIVHI
jgi:hypothetical protein